MTTILIIACSISLGFAVGAAWATLFGNGRHARPRTDRKPRLHAVDPARPSESIDTPDKKYIEK